MKRLTVMQSFFALGRPGPFEPSPGAPAVIDPDDSRLQADLAANGVTFEQFADHLIEQGLAQWSEDQ